MEALSMLKTAESYIDSIKKQVHQQYAPQGAPADKQVTMGVSEIVAIVIYSSVSVFSGFLLLAGFLYVTWTGMYYPVQELLGSNVSAWKKGLLTPLIIITDLIFPTMWSFIRLSRGGGVLPYAPMKMPW